MTKILQKTSDTESDTTLTEEEEEILILVLSKIVLFVSFVPNIYDTGLFIKYIFEYFSPTIAKNNDDQVIFTNWKTLWPYFALFYQIMAIIAGIEVLTEIILTIVEFFVENGVKEW